MAWRGGLGTGPRIQRHACPSPATAAAGSHGGRGETSELLTLSECSRAQLADVLRPALQLRHDGLHGRQFAGAAAQLGAVITEGRLVQCALRHLVAVHRDKGRDLPRKVAEARHRLDDVRHLSHRGHEKLEVGHLERGRGP